MQNKYQEKIAHLTESQVNELMKRYYNNEKNSILLKKFNINIKSSLLYKTFPLKVHDEIKCPACNKAMKSYRESKSSYSWNKIEIFCETCMHVYEDNFCTCDLCIEERKKLDELNRVKIKNKNKEKQIILFEEIQLENSTPIIIDKLNIKDKLYISSLLRTCLSEDLTTIKPLASSNLKLAPTQEYMFNIISYLKKNLIISFSIKTSLESIIIENNGIASYYPKNATFTLNTDKNNYKEDIQNLLHLSDRNKDFSKEGKIILWTEIGLHECLEFLYAKMEEYNLPTEYIGDKTVSALKVSLKDFSISENFNFIWRVVKNAAAYYQKDKITKKHAVNTIAGGILRNCEKAKVDLWDIKGYGRDYNYPQSVISEVFFNNILRIGEKGFTSKIGSNI